MARIDRALAGASRFLIGRQDSDGAWRSDNYAALKQGPALTPLATLALLHAPASRQRSEFIRKAASYLAALVRADGTIDEGEHGLSYPVYSAAGAVLVLSDPATKGDVKARDAWLKYLRARQLTEALGWTRTDKEYGGWGYAAGLPTKAQREPLTESNISATAISLEALRASGCSAQDPAFTKAMVFVARCQNFTDGARNPASVFDDGGFFFIYDDPNRNKAGVAGHDTLGRQRLKSYGSASADGLRCLRACGLAFDHPRVSAARKWLEKHFRPDANPGDFPEDRAGRQASVYFYYAWTVSRALREVAGSEASTDQRKVEWAAALADELLSRQDKDGSWSNPADYFQEDDAILGTSLAAQALGECRRVIGAGHR